MKQLYMVSLVWKHNSPDMSFRYLDKEKAEKIFKSICAKLGNISYYSLHLNEVHYMIDITGISYVELRKDVIVRED